MAGYKVLGGSAPGGGGGTALIQWGPNFGTPGGDSLPQVQAIAMPAIELTTDLPQIQTIAMPAIALTSGVAQVQALAGTALGAPFWQSVETGTKLGSGTLIINKPTGTVSGDLLIAHFTSDSNPNYPTPPAGWTLIQRAISPGSTPITAGTWYKIAGGSEPASYEWTIPSTNLATGEIHRFNGTDPTTPINVSAISTLNATALVTDPVSPSVTTTVENCMIIRFLAHHHAALSNTHTPAASHVERTDFEVSNVIITSATSMTRVYSAIAATLTAVHDCTETVSTDAVMITIAIAPGELIL